MPKVLVMVEEKAIGSISTSEVESMAVKLLGDNGIETVDQNMVQNNLDRIQKVFRGAGDNRAAAAIGREFGADVILMGEAIAKPNAAKIGDSNLRSYNAAATIGSSLIGSIDGNITSGIGGGFDMSAVKTTARSAATSTLQEAVQAVFVE